METAFKGFTEGMLVESKPISQELEVVEPASGAAAMELFTETEVIGNFEGESYHHQQHQPQQQQVVLLATTLGGGRSSEITSNSKTTDVSLSHDYERENLKGMGGNEMGFVEADETVIVSAQTKTSTTVQTEGSEYTLTVADANAVAPSLIVEQQLQDAAESGNVTLHTEECDRLTDSNSSEKMSFDDNNSAMISRSDGIDEQAEDSADEYGEDSGNVPLNFPIKGRILARLRLHGKGHEYFMTKQQLVIGRNSSKGAVDIDIGHSSFISRNHLTIVYEEGDFFLSCGGKNGVFVDDTFQKIGAPRLTLPKSCALRFPSTQIVIIFDAAERFIDQYSTTNTKNSTVYDVDNPSKVLKALSVQIPENGRVGELKRSGKVFFSPCPSPSGTISAVNSCPASPTSAVVYSRNAASAGHRAIQPKVPAEPASGKDDRIPLFEGDDSKPPYSYAQLIVQAISSSPDKQMTLSGIYSYIARNYSYFKGNERGWQNSIRHNLSLNRYFIKVARSLDEPGKGCFWSIDPISEPKLVAQAFRRRNKRGIPFFRGTPKTLKTQSAPVSPSPIIIHPAIYTSDMKTGSTSLSAASVAAVSGVASPAVVTVATVNSIVEAVNMQRKKSHVLDLNSLRAIQSAPGSPQGFKVLSQASLKAAGVAPKATPAPITLLQPITGEEKGAPQLVPSGTVLSVASTPAVSMVTSTVPTVVSSINSEQPKLAISRAAVHGQPIFIQLAPSSMATAKPPEEAAQSSS